MKNILFIVLIASMLTACAPAATPDMINTQNTALAIVQTGVALTQTALPTVTVPPTATIVYPTPSPLPTLVPLPIFTPDAIQVERWREYQTELAKAVLSGYDPALFQYVLCEWDILGRSGQKVYVWAVCDGVSVPAVIYLKTDGSIQKVDVPGVSSDWVSDIRRMFPESVREKFLDRDENVSKMLAHLEWRRIHPEEPPLVVLSATPAP